MTIDSFLELGVSALVLSSFWMLFVLVVRRPVSRWLGARWAYYLWLVPLVGLLAIASPMKSARQQFGFPEIEIPAINLMIGGAVTAIAKLNTTNTNESTGTAIGFSFITAKNLLFLWLIGGLVSLLMLTVHSIRFSRRVRQTSRLLSTEEQSQIKARCTALADHTASVRINALDNGPAVAGLFRPVLLLPEDFFSHYSPKQQTLILQHEHQHLLRRDLLWLYLARIYRCLFWFNPLVYPAERYLQLDQELSCDEKVLADQNAEVRRVYGETLLLSTHTHEPLPQVDYLPSFSQIKERTTMLKHHNHRIVSHLLGGILVVAVSIVASVAYGVGDSSEETQSTVKMRPEIYKELMAVQSHIESYEGGDTTFSTALETLKQLETDYADESLTDYELAQLNNLAGYINYLRSDYPSAIVSYEHVVELSSEAPILQASTFKTLAQLYFTLDDYEQALVKIEQWEKVIPGGPTFTLLMLKGQAYFQLEQYQQALPYIDKAIEQIESQGRVPKENQLLLQRVCRWEVGDLEGMGAVLEKLIEHYPNAEYERMLEGVHMEIQQQKKS